jgi:molybdate transport system ATP-binding protein
MTTLILRGSRLGFRRCHLQHWTRSTSNYVSSFEAVTAEQPLVELQGRLHYPNIGDDGDSRSTTAPIHLSIYPPSSGGHALLGANSTGKTLITQAIASQDPFQYLDSTGTFQTADRWHSRAISHVSFASHQQLVQEGGTASKAISQGGNLTKAAQFLVVRFSLYHLLQRDVATLSTGEIRKVLLIRALSSRPRLLVLDNAFDGLDVPSRDVLKDLVSKTLTGFKQDILVQAVSSKATAHTQVLLATHRAEEIVEEMKTCSYWDVQGKFHTELRGGRSNIELLQKALGVDEGAHEDIMELNWDDPSLPSKDSVKTWWAQGREVNDISNDGKEPVVRADNLFIQRGDVTLLHALDWTVQSGERWLVAGGNGAGKSTLSRLLAKPEDAGDALQVLPGMAKSSGSVGWVSTEGHMQMANSEKSARDVLTGPGAPPDIAQQAADWLGVGDSHVLDKTFSKLSQGQQKLILIASALAQRPPLLVLDEPCQGLDLRNRQRLLGIVERICQATDMSLVYITHHFEELLPSVTHVLHLKDRKDVYNGTIQGYDPETTSEM